MTEPLTIPIAVDIVALTVIDHTLHALVVRRGIEPFKNHLALPGGFLRDGEQTEEAAARELEEETGITPPGYLEQLRTTYEAIWGSTLDPRNFHRKATKTASFIEPTGGTVREGAGRPATLYHLVPGVDATAFVLDPPLRRPPTPTPASSMKSASARSTRE